MGNYKLIITPTDKLGNTNVKIEATATGKIINSISRILNIKEKVPTYNTGIESYNELIEGGTFNNIVEYKYKVPFQFTEDGKLIISEATTKFTNLNGTYTPEDGKWKNPELSSIKYTGDNGLNLILRYEPVIIEQHYKCIIYQWNMQILNKTNWISKDYAGQQIGLFTTKSKEWSKLNGAWRPVNGVLYYTQEVRDNQGDDTWMMLINANDTSAEQTIGSSAYKLSLTDEQVSYGINESRIQSNVLIAEINDMTAIPKGVHELSIVWLNSGQEYVAYKVILNKEV